MHNHPLLLAALSGFFGALGGACGTLEAAFEAVTGARAIGAGAFLTELVPLGAICCFGTGFCEIACLGCWLDDLVDAEAAEVADET